MKFYELAVNTPFNNSILTYSSNDDWLPGQLVKVPLGKNRLEKACVLKEVQKPEEMTIKEINGHYEWNITLPGEHLNFLEWTANYYQYPFGQLLFDALPKPLKRPKDLNFLDGKADEEIILSDQQKDISERIEKNLGKFYRCLIHGVTGSGKSMVYFDLINKVLEKGQSVLFLLPEINLTPQFLKSFEKHVPCPIYSYNSSLSNSDKFGLINLLLNNDSPKVILGVRSSLFLPISNLGLIIVDEEHDNSFKQEDRCPYNARDLSMKLAQMKNCPVVLGSATPSMETFYNFSNQENSYFSLEKRYGKSKLPEIEILDSRLNEINEDIWPFHPKGLEEIKDALERKEQVLVFVNRLGFASFIQCRNCGHQFYCPNCSIPLKYYKKREELKCQTCDYKDHAPDICPDCGNMNLLQKGFGTEKLAEVLDKEFPEARIGRFDRDEISTFNQLEERLDEFHTGKLDILVGTQMLSKGHNFEKVNLVLILGIDSQLNFPDFRSSERAYQLLTQVSGRSGRFGADSKVVVQTMAPELPLFDVVKNHSFLDFYESEVSIRQMCECPPFKKLAMIYITSKFQNQVLENSTTAAQILNKLSEHFKDIQILGPRPALVEKRSNKFTWSIMLKSQNPTDLHNLIYSFKKSFKPHYSISYKVDLDPYHLY